MITRSRTSGVVSLLAILAVLTPPDPASGTTAPHVADAGMLDVTSDDGSRVVGTTAVSGDGRMIDLTIASTAMGGNVMTRLILPRDWYQAPTLRWPTLYLLQGANSPTDYQSWTTYTDVRSFVDNDNVLVAMPSDGIAGFYSDWWNHGTGVKARQWETFQATELPQILERGYRANDHRALAGLSLGGYGAVELAARRPGMYRFAATYSGNVNPSGLLGGVIVNQLVTSAGEDPKALWGDRVAQADIWLAHDPVGNADQLRGTTVFVSSGNGLPGQFDPPLYAGLNVAGALYEAVVFEQSTLLTTSLVALGTPVVIDFYGGGTHQWGYWQNEFHKSWPLIVKSLTAP